RRASASGQWPEHLIENERVVDARVDGGDLDAPGRIAYRGERNRPLDPGGDTRARCGAAALGHAGAVAVDHRDPDAERVRAARERSVATAESPTQELARATTPRRQLRRVRGQTRPITGIAAPADAQPPVGIEALVEREA